MAKIRNRNEKRCIISHSSCFSCNFLFVPVTLDSGLKDRIAILQVLERDALYGTLDLLYDGLLLTIIHV